MQNITYSDFLHIPKIETNKGYKFSISEAIGSWQDNKKLWKVIYVEEFKDNTN